MISITEEGMSREMSVRDRSKRIENVVTTVLSRCSFLIRYG